MKHSKCAMMGLLVMGLCLTGCRRPAKDPTQAADHTGTYTLVTVNGSEVPYTPVPEGSGPQVQSGAFTLNADGTVTHATNFGQVDGKELSHESNGAYTLDASRVSFQWKGAGTTTATLEGNTLTMNWDGVIFAYRK